MFEGKSVSLAIGLLVLFGLFLIGAIGAAKSLGL